MHARPIARGRTQVGRLTEKLVLEFESKAASFWLLRVCAARGGTGRVGVTETALQGAGVGAQHGAAWHSGGARRETEDGARGGWGMGQAHVHVRLFTR